MARVHLDHLVRLPDARLQSLLDLALAIAWAGWRRLRAWQVERQEEAESWRALLAWAERHQRARRAAARRARGTVRSVVVVLLSESGMVERVRCALAGGTSLCSTSTWAELERVVARVSPCAVFADPAADTTGDPEGHLARLARESWLPVVLYTALTPETAAMLLRLGPACPGIWNVIFRRYDDAPARFVELVAGFQPDDGFPLQAA